jgi:hypothetical protein
VDDPNITPTTPNGAKNFNIGGAGLAVWALVGQDMLGTAGFRDLNHSDPGTGGVAPWADDLGWGAYQLYQMDSSTNQPVQQRSSFVEATKMKFATRKMWTDPLDSKTYVCFEVPAGKVRLPATCFLDSFDQPILYYRANLGRPRMVCDLTPNEFFVTRSAEAGIYNMTDNTLITTQDYGAGNGHFKGGVVGMKPPVPPLDVPLAGPRIVGAEPSPRGSFGWTVYNPNATAWSPYNAETYILLSAGPDGVFGTPDDIANYEMNQ